MSSLVHRARAHVEHAVERTKNLANDLASKFEREMHSHTHLGAFCHSLHPTIHNRFHSFAPPRTQNGAKWFVDGCGYFYALSVAIEQAHSQIWIMDWWLSPELYLRRPPSKNENYRLDRMLKAAAERGVKINVLIYKEVERVLSLASIHTKHALEALHPNIAVFRHPDHNPSGRTLAADFKNLFHGSVELSKLPQEGLEALYGLSDDVVLYWAHHEKLCLIDGQIAFMGGLDACFGRWDNNQHQLADAHPGNLDEILFPGQDYNNARVFDFQNIEKWEDNKLDRTKDARMGWSDLSICLNGPIVEDIGAHFVQRWNFIYSSKYVSVENPRYKPLSLGVPSATDPVYRADGSNMHFGVASQKLAGLHAFAEASRDMPQPAGAFPSSEDEHDHKGHHTPSGYIHEIKSRFRRGLESMEKQREYKPSGDVNVQLVRSAGRWSHGVSTEHSIANAYIEVIQNSQNFIYIENQFFITATSDDQYPIQNKIGAAIVERIVKANKAGQKFKVIILMPSVPAFAGDLHAESSLGTLAIMNFQYNSICRGGSSIIGRIQAAGIDATDYIRFYNLRNYDRINNSATMTQAEQQSGVSYETARKQHDDIVGAGYDGRGERTGATPSNPNLEYNRYQQFAPKVQRHSENEDTVSDSYMLGGRPITDTPWIPGNNDEIDCFVSEELYLHTKCLIADDRVVIVGSANLNDRSQLGFHDSEIAVVIEDSTMVNSVMDGRPYQVSKFATSLRRQLFRKHLGLIPPQDSTRPNENFTPITQNPNAYDWKSQWDLLVQDPLSPKFEELWNTTAATNTDIFERVFRCVPSNSVRTWEGYQSWYGQYYVSPSPSGTKIPEPAPYRYGHVFKKNFPGGVQEVKQLLAGVRGTLVEMPLGFLSEVKDLVKEGLGYNVLTEEIYT